MSVLDKQLIFSTNQLIGGAYPAANYISTNYIDLGASGTDTWGSGTAIYPGWWKPKKLIFTVGIGAVPVTGTYTTISSLKCHFIGVDSTTYITSTASSNQYIYFTTIRGDKSWLEKGNQILQVIAVPKINHRYLFINYQQGKLEGETSYANVNSWISFDSQSLSVGSYGVGPI